MDACEGVLIRPRREERVGVGSAWVEAQAVARAESSHCRFGTNLDSAAGGASDSASAVALRHTEQ
jgi:hypothetical protein